MPWTSRDVGGKTKLAKSAKDKRQWVHIANALYKSGKSEKQAIIEANGVLKKEKSK